MPALAAVLMSAAATAWAGGRIQRVYAFGLAASFADSIVYITDLQPMDSVFVESRTGFLENRDLYSAQLRDYLAAQEKPRRVCAFFFDEKQKDAEKRLMRMKRRYAKDGKYDVRFLSQSDFRFSVVPHLDETAGAAAPAQKEKKAGKRKKSKAGDGR